LSRRISSEIPQLLSRMGNGKLKHMAVITKENNEHHHLMLGVYIVNWSKL
jgi:hypothetical protein